MNSSPLAADSARLMCVLARPRPADPCRPLSTGPVSIQVSEPMCGPRQFLDGFSQFRSTSGMLADTLLQQQQTVTAMFVQAMRDSLPFTPHVHLVLSRYGWRDGAFAAPLSAAQMKQLTADLLSFDAIEPRDELSLSQQSAQLPQSPFLSSLFDGQAEDDEVASALAKHVADIAWSPCPSSAHSPAFLVDSPSFNHIMPGSPSLCASPAPSDHRASSPCDGPSRVGGPRKREYACRRRHPVTKVPCNFPRKKEPHGCWAWERRAGSPYHLPSLLCSAADSD